MHFRNASEFDYPVERLFEYHEQAGAINRLIPPWEPAEVLSSEDSLSVGAVVQVRNKIGPIGQVWVAEHTQYRPNELFVDQLQRGPFSKWRHEHRFEAIGEKRSRLTDQIEYRLPMGPLGQVLSGWVQGKLLAMFRFRHRITSDDLRFAEQLHELGHDPNSKKVVIGISGSSGLVGRRTIELARVLGIDIVRLVRSDSSLKSARWPRGVKSFTEEQFDQFEGLDAWIHLGGVGIADRRWTKSYKEAIRRSRIDSTNRIIDRLRKLNQPPKAFICASGVGIYGDRRQESLDESSRVDAAVTGDDFLSDVAREWEAAARAFEGDLGRVALARFGMVLHPRAGALSKMLLPFRMGLGGPMGTGTQYWPWVHIDDAASILLFLALNPKCRGPFNVVAPECLPNRDFSKVLARVLHRPCWLTAPTIGLRIALGEMADSLLLASANAVPSALLDGGYRFRFPTLQGALENLLGRFPDKP
ncbi:MAG: TIGR01777 family oxidoreductase [Pirellula sp.]